MSLNRIPDNAISKYSVKLYPSRVFQSGSAGVTGSVYIFPNRSITQKDNIDERLEFAPIVDGIQIKPFDANSLEQRRIDIYGGDFSNIIAGPFRDFVPIIYTYKYTGTSSSSTITHSNVDASDINTDTWVYGDTVAVTTISHVTHSGTEVNQNPLIPKVYEYRDFNGGFWISEGLVYNEVPAVSSSVRDNINYEPALALLLDGAHPLSEDHAWRGSIDPDEIQSFPYTAPDGTVYDVLNDSAVSPGSLGVFSGFTIGTDENGIDFLDRPIISKEDVNAWPPEIEKWGSTVSPQFITLGYSDLSMHPRNMTKKDITVFRSSHEAFGRGTIAQKQLYNQFKNSLVTDSGWWAHNKHALSLNTYEGISGPLSPVLHYDNGSDEYTLNNSDGFTIDFWIKPTPTQTGIGTVVHVEGNYAITVEPHVNSIINGIPQYYRVSWHWGANSVYSVEATAPDISSNYLIRQGEWHRVTIRWSENFNNGKFDIWIDNVIDIEDISYSPTVIASKNTTMVVGGWNSDTSQDSKTTIDTYAVKQSRNFGTVSTFGDGKNLPINLQCTSHIGSLSCYNYALTQLDLRNEFSSQTLDMTKYLWKFDWKYISDSDIPIWHKLWFKGDSSKSNINDFYNEGDVNILDAAESNNVPYSTNAGHIAGMPIALVHGFCKEYVQSSYPVITGYPDMSDIADVAAYPDKDGMLPSSNGINYFIDHWKSFGWLRSLNSIITHSDEPVNRNDIIKYYGELIGDITESKSLANFYDDEIYTLTEEEQALGLVSGTDDQPETQTFLTSALYEDGKFTDADFLPPFSVILNIPIVYYGTAIKERSLSLEWTDELTNVSYTVVDHSGILYLGMPRSGNKVGHIDYRSGLICIFSPLLASACLDNFSITFDGVKDLNVMQFDLQMGKGSGTISSNKSFKPLSPSMEAHDNEVGIIGVSDVYIHDENLNILAKVKLANPILKRANDSFLFRARLDF